MDDVRAGHLRRTGSSNPTVEWGICRLYEEAMRALVITNFDGNVRLLLLRKWIKESGTAELSLEKAARIICLEPHYLSQVLHAHFGLTFSAWRRRYRASVALVEMYWADKKLNDIIRIRGNQDRCSLERAIKRMTGMTPTKLSRICGRVS